MSTLRLALRLLHEIDDRIRAQDGFIVTGSYKTIEEYRAACATRQTWLAARGLVVDSMEPAERASLQ